MALREEINSALKQAMKDKAAERLSALRLISAALKDREIALRGTSEDRALNDGDVLAILGKMVKQRQESARTYEERGRLDLAERERAEVDVIEEFLPKQLDPREVDRAIEAVVSDLGAESIRDMGKVMGALKERHSGQMDFGEVGAKLRSRLSQG